MDETIIYTDDLTDAEKVAELTEMYLTLPESIRGTLEEYDCAIYLSGEANKEWDGPLSASEAEEAEETSAIYTAAVAVGPHYMYNSLSNHITSVLQAPYIVYFSMYDSPADVLIHEVGHVLDYIATLRSGYVYNGSNLALSSSEEWEEILSMQNISDEDYTKIIEKLHESGKSCETKRHNRKRPPLPATSSFVLLMRGR